MKLLESRPRRYDQGIRLLTRGRLDKAYDDLTSLINQGDRVLDLGCGTGALTLRAAARGARVKGIDINPRMLDAARSRAEKAGLASSVECVEMGAAELDKEKEKSYDAVMSGLFFSELSHHTQSRPLCGLGNLLNLDKIDLNT
ncbi:MAG: class I SAM-dependent methyltransferase [Candidatus Aminicenantes bacterium]